MAQTRSKFRQASSLSSSAGRSPYPVKWHRFFASFKAGALARTIEPLDGIVAPLLINMKNSAIKDSPLDTLQVTQVEKEDFYQLVEAINKRLPTSPVDPVILREEYDEKWPKLEQAIKEAIRDAVLKDETNAAPKTPDVGEVLEDVLSAMRDMRQDMNRIQPQVTYPADFSARQTAISDEIIDLTERWWPSYFWHRFQGKAGCFRLRASLPPWSYPP
jgi:hypothetical protein